MITEAQTPATSGTRACGLPASASCSHTGASTVSYYSDYFGRIHVIPPESDLGLVPREGVQFPFTLYSTYLDPVSIQQITSTGAEGIELSANNTVVLQPLTYQNYTADVTPNGPELFDAVHTFTFSNNAEPVTLRLYGEREPLNYAWPWRWDWNNQFTSFLRYKTDIVRAWSGREQRIRLKEVPDAMYSASYVLNTNEAERALMLSAGWSHQKFFTPLWHRRTQLAQQAAAGETQLTVTNAAALRASANPRILISNSDTEIVAKVVSIDANVITIAKELPSDLPAGADIVCVVISRFEQQPRFEHLTPKISRAVVTWREDEEAMEMPGLPGLVLDSVDGRPVFPFRPDLNNPQSSEFVIERDGFAGDTGFDEITYKTEVASVVASRTFTLSGEQPWEFIEFAELMGGRQGSFWADLYYQELVLTNNVDAGGQTLFIRPNGYVDLLSGKPEYDKLIIRLHDKTPIYLDVTAAEEIGGLIKLTTSAAPQAINVDDVESAGFLMLCRLASDDVRIDWITDSVARVSASFRSLIDEEGQ